MTAALIKLRKTQTDLFNSSNFQYDLTGAVKYFRISEPNLSAYIVANFDVVQRTFSATFQSAGVWYDYLTGETITATGTAQNLNLRPGEYRIYFDKNIVNTITTGLNDTPTTTYTLNVSVNPNPVSGSSILLIELPETAYTEMNLINTTGQQLGRIYSGLMTKGRNQVSLTDKINNLPAGIYLIRVQSKGEAGLVRILVP
ncbi:MAG TPA: T9SS type A sorting domain-containing protein [Chitinophagaceae bacterium]|nr:T9SS type A sorting domain-containing protein [Chitinophagaceae bacterium]